MTSSPHPTPERIRRYALLALEGMPIILHPLLDKILPSEADYRPDPERFTIREAICHLADWEPIWRERLQFIAEADPSKAPPYLQGYDESQFALDHDYARADLWGQVDKFTQGRHALVAYVQTVPAASWAKVGEHGELGTISFAELITLLLTHDSYHLRQVAEFRRLATSRH